MLRNLLILAFVAVTGLATSCSPSDEAAASGAKTVAVLVQTTVNPFFLDFAEAAKAELGDGYEVIVLGGDNNADKQAKQVKDLIVQKVDALLITPCNANAVGSPIREANAAGVPVFTADTACLSEDAEVVNHVATDNYAGGRLAGQAMIEALQSSDSAVDKYAAGAVMGGVLSIFPIGGVAVLVGLAMYLPFSITLAYGVGCVTAMGLERAFGTAFIGRKLVPFAAGLIVGEAITQLCITGIRLVMMQAGGGA